MLPSREMKRPRHIHSPVSSNVDLPPIPVGFLNEIVNKFRAKHASLSDEHFYITRQCIAYFTKPTEDNSPFFELDITPQQRSGNYYVNASKADPKKEYIWNTTVTTLIRLEEIVEQWLEDTWKRQQKNLLKRPRSLTWCMHCTRGWRVWRPMPPCIKAHTHTTHTK